MKNEPTSWNWSRHPQALLAIWDYHNSWQMSRKRLQEIPELLGNVMKSMLERFPELGAGEVVLSVDWVVDTLEVRRYIGEYLNSPS